MSFPVTLTDAVGRAVTLARPPERIVSLVPSTTETLFALGLGARVAGVTRFCIRPDPDVKEKARVGGTKRVDFRKVRALAPDLILANKEENRREEVEALAAEFPVFVQYPVTVDQARRDVLDLGRLAGAEEAAGRLARGIAGALEEARPPSPPVRVAYLIWRNPYWAAGSGTYVDDLLRAAGGLNAFAEPSRRERYFPVSMREIDAARCDLILLPDEPYPFGAKHLPEFEDRPARLADGRLCSWHGAATAEGIRYLAELLREKR